MSRNTRKLESSEWALQRKKGKKGHTQFFDMKYMNERNDEQTTESSYYWKKHCLFAFTVKTIWCIFCSNSQKSDVNSWMVQMRTETENYTLLRNIKKKELKTQLRK